MRCGFVLGPTHAPRLVAVLQRLSETTNAQGMNLPGWRLHLLKGRDLKGISPCG